jgi:hypothetical protein
LVVLAAFLVELVVIAAGCNQKVSHSAVGYAGSHPNGFLGQVCQASLAYAWRFSSQPGSARHLLLSQFAVLAIVFVLTAALASALARGAVTFGRAFLGIWLAVIVATEVGSIVQLLIVDERTPGHHYGRLTYALFAAPNGYNFFAGLCLGFLTALVAALVAVATARPVAVPASTAGWDTTVGGSAVAPDDRPERDREQDSFATTQYPVYPPPAPVSTPLQSDRTTQLPRVAPPPSDDPNKTTMLPRNFPGSPEGDDPGRRPE